MAKLILNVAALLLLLSLPTARVLAEESAPDPAGRPERFAQGKKTTYALWEEDGIWKLRATADEKGGAINFTGSVRVEGDKFLGAIQGFDKPKKGQASDVVVLHKDKKGFDFRFANRGRTDGVDFRLGKNAKTVTFKLLVGGDDDPKRILIGKKGLHPESATFTFPAPAPPAK